METKIVTVGARRFADELRCVAAAQGLTLVPLEGVVRNLQERLLDEQAACVVLDASSALAQEFCNQVRVSRALQELQILAIVDEPWGPLVPRAFSMGADDFLPADGLEQLGAKVAALSADGARVNRPASGKIILADASGARRAVIGRHLRRIGLEVWFAGDGSIEVDESLRLIVAHAQLPPDGAAAHLRIVRDRDGSDVPWVIVGTQSDLWQVSEQLAGEADVTLLDITTDASAIAFVANGLVTRDVSCSRRTVRYPYATPVRWVTAWESMVRWGYSYNINGGGLYVRTLTPPETGTTVCLELRPPFGRGRVIVDGTVAWRQGFNRGLGHPPGFGIQYSDEVSIADAAALDAGYARLCEQHGESQCPTSQPDDKDLAAWTG